MKKINKLYRYIYSDFYRCEGSWSLKKFIKYILFNPGFKYLISFRIYNSCSKSKILKYSLGVIVRIVNSHYMYKYGIIIPVKTKLGYGIKINHFSGIVINSECEIGNNVTISNNVTIGRDDRGKNVGCPSIGDNVYIGPGAKIFGKIRVGDNVAIGANAVVNKDIPNGAVVVGIPGKIISYKGSDEYIKNKYKIKYKKYNNIY